MRSASPRSKLAALLMRTTEFHLRFPISEVPYWAGRYDYEGEDDLIRQAEKIRIRGYLKRVEFLELCKWKTPRSQPRCAKNTSQQVREATEMAFHTDDQRAKMFILRTLDGVEWPTASVLLHFC